ncbi:hypothetical protein [Myroides fluvii]|uniref:hypothetical protein n=1 Tax=Myroides fluvii TaxID=2572594 RepID=UPI0018EEDDC8|nr:hypothetical protein [Myroides fluvii]
MATQKTAIYVYADWVGLLHPILLGVLVAHQAKGRKAFSFEYDTIWLKTNSHRLIDPVIQIFRLANKCLLRKSQQQSTNNKQKTKKQKMSLSVIIFML